MIAAEFDYAVASSVDDAISKLADGGADAKLLAGGHSLLPLMKLRFAAPSLLVDMRKLDELRGIDTGDDSFRIGALTRHSELQAREDMGLVSAVASKPGSAATAARATSDKGTRSAWIVAARPDTSQRCARSATRPSDTSSPAVANRRSVGTSDSLGCGRR